eukprot:scaffold2238_cov117-Isochrysis_galbana.AAC.4
MGGGRRLVFGCRGGMRQWGGAKGVMVGERSIARARLPGARANWARRRAFDGAGATAWERGHTRTHITTQHHRTFWHHPDTHTQSTAAQACIMCRSPAYFVPMLVHTMMWRDCGACASITIILNSPTQHTHDSRTGVRRLSQPPRRVEKSRRCRAAGRAGWRTVSYRPTAAPFGGRFTRWSLTDSLFTRRSGGFALYSEDYSAVIFSRCSRASRHVQRPADRRWGCYGLHVYTPRSDSNLQTSSYLGSGA